MLIDLPQDVLKMVLIFASPQDILRLRKVCRYLNDFIKVCRQQLPMPGVDELEIWAPTTGDPDHWKFIVEYTDAEPVEQGSVERKIHGINSLNLPIEENIEVYSCLRRRRRSCTVPTSRLNEMVQELCQFCHSRLNIGPDKKKQKSIWEDLGSLLQMLNDFYGECPTLRPGNVYFERVDLTTVSMVDWRAFLAKLNTQGNKRNFHVSMMIECTVPQLDYGLPSLFASRLLNSIDRYYEYGISATGPGQPDFGPTMDTLENLMLRPPGMDEYKNIFFDRDELMPGHWIGLIEAWQNGVDQVAVDSTAANEDHCSLFLKTRPWDGNEIFEQVAQYFNCELACLVIEKPRSKQLLIFYDDCIMCLAILRFAQPWHRQSRTLNRKEEGGRMDKFIVDSMPSVYGGKKHLALYRRMKELGIMTEKGRRFICGEEE